MSPWHIQEVFFSNLGFCIFMYWALCDFRTCFKKNMDVNLMIWGTDSHIDVKLKAWKAFQSAQGGLR